MSILNNVKKNKVTADFSKFTYLVSGRAKAGKTSLVYKTAKEKFGDADNLLLVAFEKGYGALDGINAIDIEKYEDFINLVDELIANKKDLTYKMVAIDTIDIMEEMATQYALRELSKQDGKRYKKMTDVAWGGAWNKLAEVVSEQITRLHKAGYSLWFITHDKDKQFTTREGIEYNKTTISVSGKVREVVVNMADFIIFIEMTKENVEDVLVDKRYIHFRGDSSLEAGSRFEKIPNKIEYDVKGFIDTIEDSILVEYGGDVKAVEKAKKEQEKEFIKKVDKFIAEETAEKVSGDELLEIIKTKFPNAATDVKEQVKVIMDNNNITSLKSADGISIEALEKIVEVLG